MKLTERNLNEMTAVELSERNAEDYTEITPGMYRRTIDNPLTTPEKKRIIIEKYGPSRFMLPGMENPDGSEYFDEQTGELVEYIPLNTLRFKIEEIVKREIDPEFKLGINAWGIVIEEAGIGERTIEDGFSAYEDIDPCYKAIHPTTGQAGFNAKCLNQFYREEIENILVIVKRVKKEIEIDKIATKEKNAALREINKRAEAAKRRLRGED